MTATLYLKHTGYPVDGRARAKLFLLVILDVFEPVDDPPADLDVAGAFPRPPPALIGSIGCRRY
jgi:hypothetical protein